MKIFFVELKETGCNKYSNFQARSKVIYMHEEITL